MALINYESLPDHIKANMAAGHILAAHTGEAEDGLRSEHLTTVQVLSEDVVTGAPVYFCNDVCASECEPGSVRLLMVESPKQEPKWQQVGSARVVFIDVDPEEQRVFIDELNAHWAERAAAEASAEAAAGVSPLEELSFLMGKMESLYEEMTSFASKAEAAFAAQGRLADVRQYNFNRYRQALLSGRSRDAVKWARELFRIETGMVPREDHYMFGRYVEFLHDSVVAYGSETLPEFLPEENDSNPDCGG